MAGMDERKSDERKAVDSVVRWLRIRERSGHPAPTSYAELVDAIGHSALLRRLLAGKTPLRVPPPRSFGQPWYSLIEGGGADGCELRPLKDRPGAAPKVTVNEWAWDIVEEPGRLKACDGMLDGPGSMPALAKPSFEILDSPGPALEQTERHPTCPL